MAKSIEYPWYYGAAAAAIAVYIGLTMSGLAQWLHSMLDVSDRYAQPEGNHVDVAIVLGYALHRDGSLTAPLIQRVVSGVELYTKGAAEHIIFSGAHPGGGIRGDTEAHVMTVYAQSLVESKPPSGRWLLEDASTSTRENALFSLELVKQHNWSSITIVTNPFHQFRSRLVFQRAIQQLMPGKEMQVYVARSPFAPHTGYGPGLVNTLVDQYDFFRELAALALYAVKGWL